MNNVIDDLGMLKKDEGCCIEQVANFCKKRKVTYYALAFEHKLLKTKKYDVSKNQNGLPRLMFICANNHLYPITDEEHRHTIFKTSSEIGGGIRTHKTQQRFEHIMSNWTKSQIYVLVNGMSFHGLLEHVKTQKEEALRTHFKHTLYYKEDGDYIGACLIDSDGVSIKMGVYRIIVTQRGLCNDIILQ